MSRQIEPAVIPKKSNAKSIFREYSEVTKLNASMTQKNSETLEAVTPIKLNETQAQEMYGESSQLSMKYMVKEMQGQSRNPTKFFENNSSSKKLARRSKEQRSSIKEKNA